MAINKVFQAALKALSYPDLDFKKNYLLARKFEETIYKAYDGKDVKKRDFFVDYEERKIRVRSYRANTAEERKILIFLHGGGWVLGTMDTYDFTCAELSKATGCTVFSIDYSLAPEAKFPIALEECYAVVKKIFFMADMLFVEPAEITLIGDSAGGNLVAALGIMARDRGEFAVERQILIYPVTYYTHNTSVSPFESIRTNGEDYLLTSKRMCDYMELYVKQGENLENSYLAPLLAKDFSNLPDTLLITAEYDLLRDEGEALARKLQDAGSYVEMYCMEDALHGFFHLPTKFSYVQRTYQYIRNFLNR